MAVCAAALAVVAYLKIDRVWVIDAIAVLRGTIMVCNNPSRQALMVPLVGHRLFSHITMNWRKRPLISHDVVVNLIGATKTRSGLQVTNKARLDKRQISTRYDGSGRDHGRAPS
jgi:hypothetical protein